METQQLGTNKGLGQRSKIKEKGPKTARRRLRCRIIKEIRKVLPAADSVRRHFKKYSLVPFCIG